MPDSTPDPTTARQSPLTFACLDCGVSAGQSCAGPGIGYHDARYEAAGWDTSTPDPTTAERPRCDTCRDTRRVPWVIEADPNCYQRPDDDGTVPCPDCVPAEPDAGDVTLTEAEIDRLHDAVFAEGYEPAWRPVLQVVERILAAREADARREGGVTALNEAAEATRSRFEHSLLNTQECAWVETWLRDRAARLAGAGHE